MAQTEAKYGSDGTLSFIRPGLGLAGVNNLWADCPYLEWLHDPTIGVHWFDHFTGFVTAHNGLTSDVTDGGSATITAGSYLTMNTHSDAEDEIYVGATTPTFTLAAGKDLWFEARVRLTEANVNDANIIVGLSSIMTDNTLQDAGAGPPADYSGLVFFKVLNGTVWQAESAEDVGATESTITDVGTFTTGLWYRLGIKVVSNTLATFYINGVPVGSRTVALPTTAIGPLFGAKAGGANAEILYVDWFRVFQLT